MSWSENHTHRSARWRAENSAPPPTSIVVIDDDISADAALRLARSGSGLLWRGDFHNAKQLMRAMDRRIQRRRPRVSQDPDPAEIFHANRRSRSQRAALLGKLLIALEPDYSLQLRRAPDSRAACRHAYGQPTDKSNDIPGDVTLVSLSELLGVISAYEWHRRGIEIAALDARIHPSYGVFSPTRNEYIDLVASAPWPQRIDHPLVFDIGTGTGVLAALMVRRGAREVVATDIDARAVQCARENMTRLGVADSVHVAEADLWPTRRQRADLVVCNPPWMPGRPTSGLERGIYDPESDVLNRFLDDLPHHLTSQGEGWLILSDLAERLGLRASGALLRRFADAGLTVAGKLETKPRHQRAANSGDPLHAARARERTILWRLTM